MADQIFLARCGFFDAVDNDRTYSAEQMNLPYKRIVANGVFSTPQGTPSTDLQVVSADGMDIIVSPGEGMFAHKWFTNPVAMTITVPTNTGINARIDSVIVQVDERLSGRTGNIVYRHGTPAANAQPPEINTIADVTEYRIANITVAPSASTITDADITDLRGSLECPWVTSLIQQVDTSTLWNQFNAAYTSQFNQYNRDYEAYKEAQQHDWEDFLASLTSELTITPNIVVYTSSYVATSTVTHIPINISSYYAATDILQVYINGLYAAGKYTLNADHVSIDLNTPIAAGDAVYFLALKSVVSGDIESAAGMMMRLDDKINGFMADSGWRIFQLENGAESFGDDAPEYRQIGNRVYLRGSIQGLSSVGTTICTLPVSFRPSADHVYTTAAISGTDAELFVTITISASDGTVKLSALSDSIDSTYGISIATTYLSWTGNNSSIIYNYMGSVPTYSNLPVTPKIGDIYMVNAADPVHYIGAGDNVMWNGATWELLQSVITPDEIDEIISSIS